MQRINTHIELKEWFSPLGYIIRGACEAVS